MNSTEHGPVAEHSGGDGNSEWLTASFTEDLHWALLGGEAIRILHDAIGRLTHATLAGLMEYGCLRWSYPALPPLPTPIMESGLGRSLRAVASPLGIRTSGLNPGPTISMSPRPSEFTTFHSRDDVLSDGLQFFQMRFKKATLEAGFHKNVANALAVGLNEMVENAARHAQADVPSLAGYFVRPNIAQFGVVDVGRGVLASLHDRAEYRGIASNTDAIRMALRPGVTSDPSGRGGLGFQDIFKALTEQWGVLRFRSGGGCVTMDGLSPGVETGTLGFPPALPGFQVMVTCRSTAFDPGVKTV